MNDLLREGVRRLIDLHRPDVVVGLPGGMAGCRHCSHGPGIGDEASSGGVFWPCPTLQALAGIHGHLSQIQSVELFRQWLDKVGYE